MQTGSFGACLMAEPALVADCVQAMRDAVAVPVTVKHRIGLDDGDDYAFVRDFVGTGRARRVASVFIVHARNAVLKGLSPKENREVPPLRYDVVRRLKRDFPGADDRAQRRTRRTGTRSSASSTASTASCSAALAYHDPYLLARRSIGACSATTRRFRSRADSRCESMVAYATAQLRARRTRCARSRATCSGSITAVRAAGASGRCFPTRRS